MIHLALTKIQATKQIFKRLLFTAILLVAVGFGFWGWQDYRDSRLVAHGLKGINIGDGESEVKFKYAGFVEDGVRHSRGRTFYILMNEEQRLFVHLENKRVVAIAYYCNLDYDEFKINEIGCGDSGEDIIKRFGRDKVLMLCNEDSNANGIRQYSLYELYQAAYMLQHNKIGLISVAQRDWLKGSAWSACDS
ncbi:MAG: hypothetical protein FJY42_05720 [Betaproteobacteria bacterium]|nr:hypothetical protein [Betaproteobacteria bacterium]